jgi:hypothetical protein
MTLMVAGKPVNADQVKEFNIDKDWRKNFTILVERKDGEAFKAAGIDPKALAAYAVRRGMPF